MANYSQKVLLHVNQHIVWTHKSLLKILACLYLVLIDNMSSNRIRIMAFLLHISTSKWVLWKQVKGNMPSSVWDKTFAHNLCACKHFKPGTDHAAHEKVTFSMVTENWTHCVISSAEQLSKESQSGSNRRQHLWIQHDKLQQSTNTIFKGTSSHCSL